MARHKRLAQAAALSSIALAAAVCGLGFVDRGPGPFVVDNRTDQPLVARVKGFVLDYNTSPATRTPRQDTLALPAGSRLAVVVIGFADTFMLDEIDILTSDCAVVSSFGADVLRSGHVMAVDPGPSARLVTDFPETETLAKPTDQCRAPSR